jgi:hypothetical protein
VWRREEEVLTSRVSFEQAGDDTERLDVLEVSEVFETMIGDER